MAAIRMMVVVGTRPEAIKLSPVIKAAASSGWIEPIVVATAQHRQMLDQVVEQFAVHIDHDLDLMTEGQTLSGITARCVAGLDQVVSAERPDIIVGQGDTTTTFAAALSAFYHHVPFAHVEAGLRTFDLQNPFPEEFNRQATSKLTAFHFAPTEQAREHLLAEGVPTSAITVTGNTVIDALLMTVGTMQRERRSAPVRNMLLTLHRRENFGAPLKQVGTALKSLLETEPDLNIVWPVHPNPNVREWAYAAFSDHPRVCLSPPLEYRGFVEAMLEADFILSDSGGVQEEAPALGRPVLVLRETTERPEAVTAGVAKLVGTDADAITTAVRTLMHDAEAYAAMARGGSPYGDGHASERIIDRLAHAFRVRGE
jgi:UDP-N-acetylglucosamine 2-epimerase (non-hydrolysing)